MSRQSRKRIKIAKRLMNDFLSRYQEDVLAVFIIGSVARHNATKYSDLNIQVVYKNEFQPYKQIAEMVNGVCVEWTWKPKELFQPEIIKKDFSMPFNLYNSITLYDDEKWFENLKKEVIPTIKDKNTIQLRTKHLWSKVDHLYEDLNTITDLENFIEQFRMLLLPTVLLPVVATNQEPKKLQLLLQAKHAFKKMGLKKHYTLLLDAIGVSTITKKDAEFYLSNVMSMYEYYNEIDPEATNGLNKANKEYSFQVLNHMIREGYYQEVIFPILDMMLKIDLFIRSYKDDLGWWTMMLRALEQRLELTKSLYVNRKKALIKLSEAYQSNMIQ